MRSYTILIKGFFFKNKKLIVFSILFFFSVCFLKSFDIQNVFAYYSIEYNIYKTFYAYSASNDAINLYDKVEFYITNGNYSTGVILLSENKDVNESSSYIDFSNYKIYDENDNLVLPVSISELSSFEQGQYDNCQFDSGITRVYVLSTYKKYKLEILNSYLQDKFENGNHYIWIHGMMNQTGEGTNVEKCYAKVNLVKRQMFDLH